MATRWLRAVEGSQAGKVFRLQARTIIGRGGEAHIQLLDKNVSRQHALMFEREDGQMVLVDLGSTNGTRLGSQLVARAVLDPGTTVHIGQSAFVFDEREEPPLDGETEEIKVLSGPALDTTAVGARTQEITPDAELTAAGQTVPDNPLVLPDNPLKCEDPLHAVAEGSGWAYCPSCGKRMSHA